MLSFKYQSAQPSEIPDMLSFSYQSAQSSEVQDMLRFSYQSAQPSEVQDMLRFSYQSAQSSKVPDMLRFSYQSAQPSEVPGMLRFSYQCSQLSGTRAFTFRAVESGEGKGSGRTRAPARTCPVVRSARRELRATGEEWCLRIDEMSEGVAVRYVHRMQVRIRLRGERKH